MSGLLAGLATWLLLPGWSRARAASSVASRSRSVDTVTTITLLTPLACLVLLGWPVGVLVALAATPLARTTVTSLQDAGRRRRDAELVRQLPGALDLVVAALEAGRPPGSALGLVAGSVDDPLSSELATIAARLSAGGDPRAVWTHLAEHPVLGPVGRAFARADDSGMAVGRVVRAVAEEMRRTRRAAARERSRRVGVRTAGPLGLCFLPAFFLVGVVPAIAGVVLGLDLF